MFNNIKFTAKVAPKDHNGIELEIGDAVATINEYYYNNIDIYRIVGLTLNEKLIWISDGESIKRRAPKNLIKIKDPKNFLKCR